MNTNKITIIGSIIVIMILISIPTGYKIIQNHQNNLYKVVEKKIIESATKCYYDDVCQEESTTLEFLYQNNYLEKVSNPITKEYYNSNSYVKKVDEHYEFVVVE